MAHPSITMEFIPMPVTGKSSSWFSTFASIGEDTFRAASTRPRHSWPVHGRRMAGPCVAGDGDLAVVLARPDGWCPAGFLGARLPCCPMPGAVSSGSACCRPWPCSMSVSRKAKIQRENPFRSRTEPSG
jgi:hypothetical protein